MEEPETHGMDETQSDLISRHKLETEFLQGSVRHTRSAEKAENRNEKIQEDWRNCGELGEGGFGSVHKEIQDATGHYRAVKTIKKRQASRLDYSRELLVMAKLAKVCALSPGLLPSRACLIVLCSNSQF